MIKYIFGNYGEAGLTIDWVITDGNATEENICYHW